MTTTHRSTIRSDRRAGTRFELPLEVRYRILTASGIALEGQGELVNISSCGALFRTDRALSPRQKVELSVNWPVRLNATCGLRLKLSGEIVRTSDGHAALHTCRYEFVTRKAA